MAKVKKTKKQVDETEVADEAEETIVEEDEEEEQPALPEEGTELMYAEVRGDNYHEYRAVVTKCRNKTVDLDIFTKVGANKHEGARTKVLPYDPAVKSGWWKPLPA